MATYVQSIARINADAYHGSEVYRRAPPEWQARWDRATVAVMAALRGEAQAELTVPLERGRPKLYRFDDVLVGGEFIVPRGKDGKNRFNGIYARQRYWERKLGAKFEVRAVAAGLRVTRKQ